MKNKLHFRLLSYAVMAYLLLALTWWLLLLFTKNRDAFHAKRDLMKIGMVAEGLVKNEAEFEQTASYRELKEKYTRQEWMIVGEAAVFAITLLAGIWFIQTSYNREASANQQRRNFLLSITHELKSPIASIQLVIETILKRELPRSQAERFLKSALTENERLNELVENLLLSAKLETAYQPQFEELDLVYLLEDLLAKLATKYPDTSFSFHKDEGFPTVKLDKPGITSVVTNLLENAVKYADGTSAVEVRLLQNQMHFTLEVADSGTGIPEKEKNRIFEKFYRIGSEETRKTKGTGLGLFIVAQVVKAHKGRIFVKDNVPKGTIFRVEIPFSL